MKKLKVLIVVPSFESGGTVTSLINFVTLVDKSRYDLNVFAITNKGVNKKYIAGQCTIVGDSSDSISKKSYRDTIRNAIFDVVKRAKKGIEVIGIDISPIFFKYYAKKLDRACYDYVLAFQEGQATLFASFLKNGFKIAWVRSEYSRIIKEVSPNYGKAYEKYDRIVSVSNASMNSFLSILPQYKDIAVVQYNFLNDERIITLAKECVDDLKDTKDFIIISVGRIDPVKRFSEIPRIARELSDKKLKFRWYILGGVAIKSEYELLVGNIRKYEIDNVILLGNKSNPYPYIKKSDLLVSLSSSETFNNTLTEAKILGTPVVTTNYPCAYESIRHCEEGIITSIDKISDELFVMITDKDGVYSHIKSVLSNFKYDKAGLLDGLYKNVLN